MSERPVLRQESPFQVISEYTSSGDQPKAIRELAARLRDSKQDIVLMGATSTGESTTTAWLVEEVQRPALVIEPDKTLAAQLAAKFRELLPNNAVECFVSYYDYYQSEAYIPQTDTYIKKDSSINDEVERLHHSATNNLLTRRDTVAVASASCIYGLGTPKECVARMVELKRRIIIDREDLLRAFVSMQRVRNDTAFIRSTFRVRGDIIEIIPVYEGFAIRIEMFGDEIDTLAILHPLASDVISEVDHVYLFPTSHCIAGEERMKRAFTSIEEELVKRLTWFETQGKLLETQRLCMCTTYDLEMLHKVGICSGVENYSRHIDGRGPGAPPHTLLDYFAEDFLLIIDESHVTVPQIGAMFEGGMFRKRTLVDHGFRLPSAMDSRPLRWDEFVERTDQAIYLSTTPGDYKLERSDGVVERIVCPTGLVGPKIVVKPTKGQIDGLLEQVRERVEEDERVLVTILAKKVAEDLTTYLAQREVRVEYLYSDIDTLRHVELLHELRQGGFSALAGINLLREGLDPPEVSLVSILNVDKEGFLYSTRSLIQAVKRAVRNVSGEIRVYADTITDSMRVAIDKTERRREIQVAYSTEHGINPKPLRKKIADVTDMLAREQTDTEELLEGGYRKERSTAEHKVARGSALGKRAEAELAELIEDLSAQMLAVAENLQFGVTARLRDEVADLKKKLHQVKAAS